MPESKLFASTGEPILQSRSPDIFNAAFSHLKLDARYIRLAAFDAADIVGTAREIDLAAFNVTSPFKEEIMGLLDSVDGHAQKIGAVNTVIVENGKMGGHNTDYIGVQDALSNRIGNLKGKKAVVLGAGGAAKAAAYGLVSAGVQVTVINRTAGKASRIASSFNCRSAGFETIGIELAGADMLVSCLPISEKVVPAAALRKGLVVMDAYYGSKTALQKDAQKNGCTLIDGREWLLYQAVPRFEYLTGKMPPIEEMRKALYAKKAGRKPNIALIGFMGAGKSTVGKILAQKTGMEFLDTDSLIEKDAGASVKEIFKSKGEKEFRKIEKEIVNARISNASGKVFSCGGGIILDKSNRDAIKRRAITIWLWVSPQIAAGRIKKGGASRPLLEGAESMAEKSGRIIRERMDYYAEASDLVINTGNRTPEQIAERITYEINQAFGN